MPSIRSQRSISFGHQNHQKEGSSLRLRNIFGGSKSRPSLLSSRNNNNNNIVGGRPAAAAAAKYGSLINNKELSATFCGIDLSSDETASSSKSLSSSTASVLTTSSSSHFKGNYSEKTWLKICIALLSDDNYENNKTGLEKLLQPETEDFQDVIAKSIVYGDGGGGNETASSRENEVGQHLRRGLVVFLSCNFDDDDEDSIYSSEYDDNRDDNTDDRKDDCGKPDTQWYSPTLHLLALHLVVHSLELILSSDSEHISIDFKDPFWTRVVPSIVHNVEQMTDPTITGVSLKCLRLLHSLEPLLVKHMLQLSLMPYLIYLKEYGEKKKIPLIESEASRLIKRADIQATRYIEI